ncbi:hypothetical protein [Flavobacterium sp. ASW18X]|uniref:hypothetical protein n=1 Tax=Flavobacterium sp. ASW18X TaxID=2572595 RepID=UPI0010AEBD0E|nr:hypothetical protein [Flavobacterium sp. ASW18X]TKD61431.1 hypothetical protein FBT53_11665 [Flavobacterium sp. ASW18X]
MKKTVILFSILISISSCGQKENNGKSDFKIDENIKKEVDFKLSESEFGESFNELFLVYDNVLLANFYENDSLIVSTIGKERKMPFKSFYYVKNDTISIDGAYGLFGGFGFSIKFVGNKPMVYHMLAGDDFPEYSESADGQLKFRIEVQCTESTLTLSKFPEPNMNDVIYGIVEFKSKDYYSGAMLVDNEEHGERKKTRMDMKIYFKSKFVDFEKL